MDFTHITRLLDLFKKEPGLVMPPIQLYATRFALSSPPYNTGLFNNLHGRPVTYLDKLVERCVESAEKLGLVVVEDFKYNVGNIPVDAPQVASLMASALGEFNLRYGAKHQKKIHDWIRESFDSLLPPLKPAHRTLGAELFKGVNQNKHYRENSRFRALIDKQAVSLESESLVTASDFLITRIGYLRKASDLQLKSENGFEP